MTELSRHADWQALNDFADEVLPVAQRAPLAAHLAECATCREQLEALRQVVRAVHDTRDIAVPDDLWPAIRSSIGSELALPRPRARRARTFTLSVPALAAAAVLVIALSVSGTLWLSRETAAPMLATARLTHDAASMEHGVPAQLTATDHAFLADVTTLEAQLARQRDSLRPETIAMVERSLRTIDVALAEARAALLADPANDAIRGVLESTYRQKMDFLRRATQIASNQ